MNSTPDPLMPPTARFPLSPAQGRIVPVAEGPSRGGNRPFGMRFGVVPAPQELKHGKVPTQKSRTKQTAIYDDGQISGYKSDTEYYTEMDEE